MINMKTPKLIILLLIIYSSECARSIPDLSGCEVAARTEQGFVCGRRRQATDGAPYASFRGIPYAKQPLGELRFKELEPAEPFSGIFNATEAGPICPQVDVFYDRLVSPKAIAEDCIRINIHVPFRFLPKANAVNKRRLLPVFFWIHGGSFSFGSGDPDFHGPEYLMTRDMVFVSFNYRLNIFGFLSIENNKYFPGNNGLRDAITALKWVKRNIKHFGGDPNKVTIGGQSAGGAMADLLAISPAAKGLFKQVIALSGYSIASFFSYSQAYSTMMNTIFFLAIGINPFQDQKKVHDALVAAPLEVIYHGNKVVLDTFAFASFSPVIESPLSNFTTVIPKDPELVLNEGAGKEYPMVLGFCTHESLALKPRMVKTDLETKLKLAPISTMPLNLIFSATLVSLPLLISKHLTEYFDERITLENYLLAATDGYFIYPSQRLIQKRLGVGAAKTFLYQFAYHGDESPLKEMLKIKASGAVHGEDITYFFRSNTYLGPMESNELAEASDDSRMKNWMTTFIANFVINGSPADNETDWPPTKEDLKFQNIETPFVYNFTKPPPNMVKKLKYYTELYKMGMVK